ncbi:MAG TPA: PepSY domain-containing protein [Firmicutes bacterium]|nr:PepSY domain-containing protein [Bacillota bacterium]
MQRRKELDTLMWFATAKKAAVPLLGATLVFSYVSASGTAAAKTPAAPAAAVQEVEQKLPEIKGSIFLGRAAHDTAKAQEAEHPAAKEDAPDPALAAKAKLSPARAEAAALQAYPGAKVVKTELGDENGYLVYQVALTAKTGESLDVKVDAGSGQVLAQEKDAGDETEQEKLESQKSGAEADTDNIQVEQEGEFQN